MGLKARASQPKVSPLVGGGGVLGGTRTETDNKSPHGTRFLLVFSSDVARADGGPPPDGRARSEPNERVHEQRAELCGGGGGGAS